MPQLNPSPWLNILIFSWVVFLALLLPKILTHNFPYEPNPESAGALEPLPWIWPWH
uniref:ATP synthase complex subunit 8 n=1 Tax=Gigantactis vanhoeffeni TaxID=242958 RepID=D3KS54_GIGVA|nr:ATP synthase F0 subunit 8 [Gigantactis vanhoeffeni]BAI77291.1 ATPase subunit 8 [Gigantactis vanhoeffeni]